MNVHYTCYKHHQRHDLSRYYQCLDLDESKSSVSPSRHDQLNRLNIRMSRFRGGFNPHELDESR